MFSKKKETSKIDPEQRELIENARRRVKEKKNVFRHFIVFLAGAILFIVLNLLLDFGADFRPFDVDWFVWAILIWFFILLIHFLNVFLLNTFMGKKWENEQMDRLVAKQKSKISKLENKAEQAHTAPESEKKSPFQKPNQPLNS